MPWTGALSLGAGGEAAMRDSRRPMISPTDEPSIGGMELWPPGDDIRACMQDGKVVQRGRRWHACRWQLEQNIQTTL